MNGGYFAQTSCTTTINQLKVFDIIPSIAVGEVTFHKHVYFALSAAIELNCVFENARERSRDWKEILIFRNKVLGNKRDILRIFVLKIITAFYQ